MKENMDIYLKAIQSLETPKLFYTNSIAKGTIRIDTQKGRGGACGSTWVRVSHRGSRFVPGAGPPTSWWSTPGSRSPPGWAGGSSPECCGTEKGASEEGFVQRTVFCSKINRRWESIKVNCKLIRSTSQQVIPPATVFVGVRPRQGWHRVAENRVCVVKHVLHVHGAIRTPANVVSCSKQQQKLLYFISPHGRLGRYFVIIYF